MFFSFPVRLPWQVTWASWESYSMCCHWSSRHVWDRVSSIFLFKVTVEASVAHSACTGAHACKHAYACTHFCLQVSLSLPPPSLLCTVYALRPKCSVLFFPSFLEIGSHIPGWPQIYIAAEDGLELLTVLPPPLEYWDYKYVLLCPALSFSRQKHLSHFFLK